MTATLARHAAYPSRAPCLEVVLVDDHPLFSHGLALLLEAHCGTGVRVVASTAQPAAATQLVRRHRPDIALVDLALPPPGGIGVIRAAKHAHPPLRVVALSATSDEALAVEALTAGADGFVPKTCEPQQLLPALFAVACGYRVVPSTIADGLARRAGGRAPSAADRLDDHQRALWLRVARGEGTAVIARELFVSERTAKRLVADLLARLGVATRLEAAAMAGRLGLLDTDPLPAGAHLTPLRRAGAAG